MTNLHQGYEVLHEPGAMGDAGDLEDGGTVKSSFSLVPKLNEWLGERGGSKFFALLHIADAHSPFRPTSEYEHGEGAAAYRASADAALRHAQA